MMVIVTGYALFVTSQSDVILTFGNHCLSSCWHNIHIILHALSLLVVAQCVFVMKNYQSFSLTDLSKTHTTLRQSSHNCKKSGRPNV